MNTLQIVKDIRAKLEDNNEIKFSDYDLLLTLNEGYKFFRKICIDEAPEFIATTYEGTVESDISKIYFGLHSNEETDESENVFNVKLVRILELRCNGRALYPINRSSIEDLEQKGRPSCYYLGNATNCTIINLHPVPQELTSFNILAIDEASTVTESTDLFISNEVEEMLVAFVVAKRLGQDASAYDELSASLRTMLKRYVPSPATVVPYY